MSLTIYSRTYFSVSHLLAASTFTGKAAECEEKHKQNLGRDYHEHKSYVVSAVMLSAAFLEATINEVFSDCADEHGNRHKDFPAGNLMGRMWERQIPRRAGYPIAQKFYVALELNGVKPNDAIPSQLQADVDLLVKLRNALIHYEPESILTLNTGATEDVKAHRFEKSFKGKFPTNPLTGPGNAFYPEQLLGHGCAAWSVKTALAFADAFFAAFNVKPTYDHVRAQLVNL